MMSSTWMVTLYCMHTTGHDTMLSNWMPAFCMHSTGHYTCMGGGGGVWGRIHSRMYDGIWRRIHSRMYGLSMMGNNVLNRNGSRYTVCILQDTTGCPQTECPSCNVCILQDTRQVWGGGVRGRIHSRIYVLAMMPSNWMPVLYFMHTTGHNTMSST